MLKKVLDNQILYSKEYQKLNAIKGPLLFLDGIDDVAYDDIVEVISSDKRIIHARVLDVDHEKCVLLAYESTAGLDIPRTRVRLTGHTPRINLSPSMLGRMFDGSGNPVDGGPEIYPQKVVDISGLPINPTMRKYPKEYIETGISAIDGLNTLARGQKLPIFSGSGLPANNLAVHIASTASVTNLGNNLSTREEKFAVIFTAIGITNREISFFQDKLRSGGGFHKTVAFLNKADDPAIERLLTPRMALTTAEYLAYSLDYHVLVILTDMTNYCEALREISSASEDIPGRRGYPGYMYSDLASIYERAGILKGKQGSITQIIILSMPDDDITHPIPDLTGYITEGQIVLDRNLHHKGIYPPIDILPSLSRLMDSAIGKNKTREDHPSLSEQLYALYSHGRELRQLVSIIGEAALSKDDRLILEFSEQFEEQFINQGTTSRSIIESLDIAWDLLSNIPREELNRIPPNVIEKFHRDKELDSEKGQG